MRTPQWIFAALLLASLLSVSSLSAQRASVDEDLRIRRAASSAENALAMRECAQQASAVREIATAARAERRAVVRGALLDSLDERDRALATCRRTQAPHHARGRLFEVIGPELESGFGALDLTPLLTQFGERQVALLGCYERALRTHHRLRGRVSIELTVRESTGAIEDVRAAESTLDAPHVAGCLAEVVRRFRPVHPGPVGGDVTYRFPLELEPVR